MQLGTGAQRPSGFPAENTRSSDAPGQASYGTYQSAGQPGTGAGRVSTPGYHPSMMAPGSSPGSNPTSGGLGVTNVASFADAGAPSSLGTSGRRSMVLPVLALAGFTVLGGVAAFFVLSRSASGPRVDQAATSAAPSASVAAPAGSIAVAPSTTGAEAQPAGSPSDAPSSTKATQVAQGTGARALDPRRTGGGSTPTPTASATAEEASSNEPGTLVVSVSPWADVSVDGRSVGTTPLAPISLAPGPHSVILRNSELGASRSMSVTIKPGKPSSIRVDLRRSE